MLLDNHALFRRHLFDSSHNSNSVKIFFFWKVLASRFSSYSLDFWDLQYKIYFLGIFRSISRPVAVSGREPLTVSLLSSVDKGIRIERAEAEERPGWTEPRQSYTNGILLNALLGCRSACLHWNFLAHTRAYKQCAPIKASISFLYSRLSPRSIATIYEWGETVSLVILFFFLSFSSYFAASLSFFIFFGPGYHIYASSVNSQSPVRCMWLYNIREKREKSSVRIKASLLWRSSDHIFIC